MKPSRLLSFIILLCIVSADLTAQGIVPELILMPYPDEVTVSGRKFRLNESFTIILNNKEKRIFNAAVRTLNSIAGRTGLFFEDQFPFYQKNQNSNYLRISFNRAGSLDIYEDESYTLTVKDSAINLDSETDIGAVRGLATLTQLIQSDKEGYFLPGVEIKDKPRFKWRGLLIDACRHFIPLDILKKNLDAMAAVKMNVFHWHLTEDQGFRIECKTFPKLHELGSDGLYYTHEQIKEIVSYAGDRGILVMPEFDLPGHATSWLVAYPELASAPGPYTLERNWGIFDPTFNPIKEETYQFLDNFFEEMSSLFPSSYWHIGGDENNGNQWDANPEIQSFMKENNLGDNHALQNYFNKRVEKILNKYNKTMVGWYTDKQPELGKNYIIQSWKGRGSLYESARNGYRCLLSHGFYIDLAQSTEYHYNNDPIPQDSVLSDDLNELILGGEATMWAEYVGAETIDSRIWPRTAAIAERLWSPGYINNTEQMFRRLDIISRNLEETGLTHIKNYEMMLRRLCNKDDVSVLKTFVDVIKPIFTYDRKKYRRPKSFHPLTRIADAAQHDPKTAREFNYLVEKIVRQDFTVEKLTALSSTLEIWKENHLKLMEIINTSPVLREIESLSEDLSISAGIGLEAVDYVKNNGKPEQEWVNSRMALLEKAASPRGETELAVLNSIRILVQLASGEIMKE